MNDGSARPWWSGVFRFRRSSDTVASIRIGSTPSAAHVYILASRRNGTLYTGSTTDLARRVWENRTGVTPGFTKTYSVTSLVWYEAHERIIEARIREYAIKRWRRDWKLALIEAMNPDWRDLYLELNQ